MNELLKNLPWKPAIRNGALLLASLAAVTAAATTDPQPRNWQSSDGKYSVTASLAGYDRVTQRVTLKRADSTVVEVPLDRLSAVDRSYVVEETRTKPEEPEKPGNSDGKTYQGIRWQPGIGDALAVAAGEATPDDDRPVMWFRVLGELDGDL